MIVGLTYISLYIGIVFIVACASVLAITQLSEASDTRLRYELLSKLGASNRMLACSIFKQVSLYFVLPLIVAMIHSIVAIFAVSEVIYAVGNVNILVTCFASALFSAKRMASLR